MTWDEATQKVKELGEGWRLPTKEEFKKTLYPNRDQIPDLKHSTHWSSSEYDAYNTWTFIFSNGFAYYSHKNHFPFHVRPVRDLTGDTALDLLLKEF